MYLSCKIDFLLISFCSIFDLLSTTLISISAHLLKLKNQHIFEAGWKSQNLNSIYYRSSQDALL